MRSRGKDEFSTASYQISAAALRGRIASISKQVYSVGVVTAAQKERSAHSKKPTQFHYVCPMHEDVTSKKRGLCPKCKMKLVKKPVVQEPTTSSN